MITSHALGYERIEIVRNHSAYITESMFNTSHSDNKESKVCNRTIQFVVCGDGESARPNGLRINYKDWFVEHSQRQFNFLCLYPSIDGVKILKFVLQKGRTKTHSLEENNLFYLSFKNNNTF